jgi:hypothetical protein
MVGNENVIKSEKQVLAERMPTAHELWVDVKGRVLCKEKDSDDGDDNGDDDDANAGHPVPDITSPRLHPDGLWVGLPPKVYGARFRQKFTPDDAIEFHGFAPLQALPCV